jgi:hypothetical protein
MQCIWGEVCKHHENRINEHYAFMAAERKEVAIKQGQ